MQTSERLRRLHQELGKRGENAVSCYFLQQGAEILARNWRCKAGELDLVVRDGAVIRFVEVKSRRQNRWNRRPQENLSPVQRRRNFRAARLYRKLFHLKNFECRFDLYEVIFRSRQRIAALYCSGDYLPEFLPEEPCINS